jgi:predicted DNA binding CopG/RHH family protein
MELSPYVEGLRRELGSLTRFAPDEVAKLAEQLADALESSVRLTLLDVISAAAAEITQRLDSIVIDVRLSGGEPEFVITDVPSPHDEQASRAMAEPMTDEAGTARVTLRLSEALKTRIESQAAASGLSVNAWLAHAAIRALETSGPAGQAAAPRGPRIGPGQRITGYARS